MSYSDSTITSTGTSAFRIGECAWDNPTDVARCAESVWAGRYNSQKERAEAQAARNVSFLSGDHWWNYDFQKRMMVENEFDIAGYMAKPKWEKQLVFNRCMPVAEMRLAKFMRAEGTPDPIAITDDPDDQAKAESSRDVLRAEWEELLDMPTWMARLYLWGESTKTAFLELSWDRSLGDPVTDDMSRFFEDPNRPPEMDVQTWSRQQFAELHGEEAGISGSWTGNTGGLRVKLRSIFDINVWPFNSTEFGPTCTDWGHVQIVLDTCEMTAEEVGEMLDMDPVDVRILAKESRDDDGFRSRSVEAQWQSQYGGRYDRDNDSIRLHKIYRVPCKRWPKGRMAYVVGRTCKEKWLNDLPLCDAYQKSIIPLFRYQSKVVPTLLWGRCTIDDMVDPQREMNASASQEANYRNYAAMPHMFRLQGDGLTDNEIGNAPNAQSELPSWEYLPKYLPRPALPPEHARTFDRAKQEALEISGSGEADYGRLAQTSVRSGVAISATAEQQDQRAIPSAAAVDKVGCKLAESIIWCEMEYGTDERVVAMMGDANSRELGDFRGKVVRFTGEHLRPSTWGKSGQRIAMVSFQSYRNLPSTRAESRQLVDALMSTNPPVLNPQDPDDKNTILRIIGIGSAKGYVDRERKHIAKQQSEIDHWRQRQPVGPPNKTDLHKPHIDALREWMAGEEWDALVLDAPEIADDAVKHLEIHLTLQSYDLLKPKFEAVYAAAQLCAEFRDKGIEMSNAAAQAAMERSPGDMNAAQSAAQAGLEIAALFASPAPFIGMPLGAPAAPNAQPPEHAGGAHNQPPPHGKSANTQQPAPQQGAAGRPM